jgi:phage pi2 protein 07
MAHKFTIRETDPETRVILIDGDEVATLSHDDHGWAGMDMAESLVRKIAGKIGATVEED